MKLKYPLAIACACFVPLSAVAQTAAPAVAPVVPAITQPSVPADASVAPIAVDASKRWQACAADIQKLCGGLEKGRGVIRACLESKVADLTPGCKTSMDDYTAARAAAKAGDATAHRAVK